MDVRRCCGCGLGRTWELWLRDHPTELGHFGLERQQFGLTRGLAQPLESSLAVTLETSLTLNLKMLEISLTHPLGAMGSSLTLTLRCLETSLTLILLNLERLPDVGGATWSSGSIFLGGSCGG